ncbi:hypothetical protein [Spirosoma montaniterrae]|uniref:Uncharacterized protein n=1 Tax=Spirosoma montaniterrae TaxID=1178516 RepID=A0A1P9WZ82_9BACT|nr:hypothetical protein [Spirosoma montaniterrae]AQG80682.1 hypothetical protein AWR27_15910 [Spirosoma montaniterrae]
MPSSEPDKTRPIQRNDSFLRLRKDKLMVYVDPHFGFIRQVYKGVFYIKKCAYCKRTFEAKRRHAAFCSPTCQQAHRRGRNR